MTTKAQFPATTVHRPHFDGQVLYPGTQRARVQGWIAGQQRGGYRPERVEVPQPHAAISSGDRSYRKPSLDVISNPPQECLT
jgi:hypothetical protein